jgi:hypothetical protein
MFGEKLVLRPPGAGNTGRSGRGDEKNEAGMTLVAVEPALELVDPLQLPKPGRGRRRLWQGAHRNREQHDKRSEGLHRDDYPPIPISGQYNGTSRSRMTAVTTDRIAPTFNRSLLSKYPYE